MKKATTDISKALWNDDLIIHNYNNLEQYKEHILEQYKLYVDMTDKISSRRDIANTFFLTLNGIVLSFVSLAIDKKFYLSEQKSFLIFPLAFLWVLCFFWNRLINSYRQLCGAKYHVIGELETRLPASPYRKAEWEVLLKHGCDKGSYWPLTQVEAIIPSVFAISYFFVAIIVWFEL